MKRHYFIFSNGRLLRHQNTVYLHQYDGERADSDEQSLADAAAQNGCVLEDIVEGGGIGLGSSDNIQHNTEQEVISGPVINGHQATDSYALSLQADPMQADSLTSPNPLPCLTPDSIPNSRPDPTSATTDIIEGIAPTIAPLKTELSTKPPPVTQSPVTQPLESFPAIAAEPAERALCGKRPIPIEDVEAFYLFGEIDLNTKFLNFVARHRVPLHLFNYYGFYSGTFYPREEINSGYLLVRQVEHYGQAKQRLTLARQLVEGASFNILKNLRYYGSPSRGRDLSGVITAIEAQRGQIKTAKDIPTLMGIEGQIRQLYYDAWPLILTPSWAEFTRRVKRPPDNPINALISFGNSLCYTLALGEIYRTPLSPLISFLHEPGERRYSLALDIAEIFKPILCDRLIFKLVNNGELRPQHFDERLNFCYLKENGRKLFLQVWDERLKQTIEHRNLGRKVSYRRLVRLECYRLKKHLLGMEPYEPFKIWW